MELPITAIINKGILIEYGNLKNFRYICNIGACNRYNP